MAYTVTFEFEERREIDNLLGMAAEADAFLVRRKNGEPVFAEDMEVARMAAEFLVGFVKDLVIENPAIVEGAVAEMLGRLAKSGFPIEKLHNCDDCEKAGNCPIESSVRKIKAEKGAA